MRLQELAFQKRQRANFQLRFAQEKYNELENKLLQRLDCISLQIKNIKAINQKNPCNFLLHTVGQVEKQHKLVSQFYINLKQQETAVLIHKQINIQESAQLHSVIKEYQQRIEEMGCNLYTKQVDISVDHVGKLTNEKPSLSRVREFSRITTQLHNIFNLLKKIADYTKTIQTLTSKNSKLIYQCNQCPIIMSKQLKIRQKVYKTKNQTFNISKCKDSMIQTAKTKSSDDSYSSESNPQVEESRGKRKMLVIKGQQNMYKQKSLFADPQFVKIEELISSQKKRENRLRQQYQNLKIKLGNLFKQNAQLSKDYKQLIAKQKQKLIQLKIETVNKQASN